MSVEQFFYNHPVFRLEELAEWKAEHGAHNQRAIQALLQYYLKSGRLLRLRRELYAVVPPNAMAQTTTVDPYLIAAKAIADSVLGFHTALELLGVAYSTFAQFTYMSEKKTKAFEIQEQLFKPVTYPASLLNQKNLLYEVETMNRQGMDIRVTSLPRTFVDVLNRVELSGGWEEVTRSLTHIAALDIDRVIDYSLKLNNSILCAKVGYFLEQREGAFAPSREQINRLLKHKPTNPQTLTKKQVEPCRLIKKWNIMMPMSVIEKSWEEPDYDV